MSKASELVSAVQRTESELLKTVGDVISQHINALSAETGLMIRGVEFSFLGHTTFDSSEHKWALNGCSVSTSLPDKIFQG